MCILIDNYYHRWLYYKHRRTRAAFSERAALLALLNFGLERLAVCFFGVARLFAAIINDID